MEKKNYRILELERDTPSSLLHFTNETTEAQSLVSTFYTLILTRPSKGKKGRKGRG